MNQQNFFSTLDNRKRAKNIDALLRSGADLRVQIRGQFYKSKILTKKGEDIFTIYKFIPGNFQNQEAIFGFDTPDGKFFFRGSLSTLEQDLVLTIPEEVFQLVHRNDYRVDLPSTNDYVCQIVKVNGTRKQFPANLRNISLGGCLIAVPTVDLTINKDDVIQLKLIINAYDWEQIACNVKQLRPANEKNDFTLLGMQFKDPDVDFLTEVQSALMYLDRTHRHARNE